MNSASPAGCNSVEVRTLIASIQRELDAANAASGKPYQIEISIGCARLEPDIATVHHLIRQSRSGDAPAYEDPQARSSLKQRRHLQPFLSVRWHPKAFAGAFLLFTCPEPGNPSADVSAGNTHCKCRFPLRPLP